jgi:PKD repeat protein
MRKGIRKLRMSALLAVFILVLSLMFVTTPVVAQPYIPPEAFFTYEPTNPVAYQMITFDGSSSTADPDLFIEDYEWDFGDGTFGSGEYSEKQYPSAGTYVVTLTVRDNIGGLSSTSKTVIVGEVDEAKNCWIADHGGNRVVKLSADGSVICEFNQGHNSLMEGPVTLAVNPADESCWVACTYTNTVFKLSSQCGDVLCLHGTQIHPANNGEVNPSSPCIDENGDCWLVLAWIKHIVKLDQSTGNRVVDIVDDTGTPLAPFEYPVAMAIDHCNHKLWVAESNLMDTGHVSRFSYTPTTCTLDFRLDGFKPVWVDVDPTNGYCWVADAGNNRVAKISPTGAISCFYGFNQPMCVSVDPNYHCCWVADQGNNRVVRLSFSGTEECESYLGLFNSPWAVKVDPTFGSCWVSDTGNDRVMKLGGTCAPLMQETTGFTTPLGLALGYRSVCVQYTDVGPISEPVVFSFAIITDNHIHALPGYDHLNRVVDWINDNKDAEDIRFVMVLGDITDEWNPSSGRYSCRSGPYINQIIPALDSLQVPYIPIIGNHDVWYDNNDGSTPQDPSQSWFEKCPEELFNQFFSPQYDYLGNCVLPNWDKAPTPVWNDQTQQDQWSYFQNFAFDYMRYHFIGMDWNSRDDIYTSDESDVIPPTRGWPDLHQGVTDGTWEWFTNHLASYVSMNNQNENILLFAHHPLSFVAQQYSGFPCYSFFTFDNSKYSTILPILTSYSTNVDKWFAGHWHRCDFTPPVPCSFYLPCDESINSVLTTVVTKSVKPEPVGPGAHLGRYLRIVRVHDDLDVDFRYIVVAPGTVPTKVGFQDLSTGNVPGNNQWEFGDGGSGSGGSASNTYTEPGIYKVTLTVEDSSGRKASIAKAIDVITEQLTSDYPDATAYNNARKLIYDNGVLHLIYRWGPADWEAGLTYAKSTDQGRTWFEVTRSTLTGGDYPMGPLRGLYPALAVDTLGKPYTAKVRSFGLADEFDAARREKTLGWFSYDRASESGSFGHPSVVVDSEGTLHIAISISYHDGTSSEIRYYKGHPGGLIRIDNTRDYEVVASDGSGECQFASIALDNSEEAHIIWQQGSSIYHSYRQGPNAWSPPELISSRSRNAQTPSLVADGSVLHAVWQEGDKVVYKKYDGGWPTTTPTTVSTLSSGTIESYPQVVSRDGLTCVVWADIAGGNYEIFYSWTDTGSWSSPPENLSGTTAKSQYPQAAICSVSPNELCVVWTEGNSYDIRSTYFSFTKTATGTGTAHLITDSGIIQNLKAVPESALPLGGKPIIQFQHGFFSFNITRLIIGQTVNVTIILPEDMPTTTQYWKCHTPEGWYQIPMGSNDGDNIITIQLTDGGTGDDDGVANGIIVDQGGPGTLLKVNETEYNNSITQPIDVSRIRFVHNAVNEKWVKGSKWPITMELMYWQKCTKYLIELDIDGNGNVTRVGFRRWGSPITEIPYDLAEQSLANLPPGFAIGP